MKTMALLVTEAARRYGDRTALVTDTATLTYAELDHRSDSCAHALIGGGTRPGDVVSILSENRWEWVVAYHGALKAGAVVNPLNAMLTPAEVEYITNDCGSRVIFGSATSFGPFESIHLAHMQRVIAFDDADTGVGGGAEPFATALHCPAVRLPVPRAGSDLCSIAYTSGTTGFPKGAMQPHRAIAMNVALTAAMHMRHAGDIVVSALPAAHVYGNVVINSTLSTGGCVRLMTKFDPAAALDAVATHRATMFEGVPAMYSMILAAIDDGATHDLSTVTRCTVGGQTMAVATMRAWEAVSQAPLLELWGMTELGGLGTTHPASTEPVHGSIGLALPGLEVRIADLADPERQGPPGAPGELWVRGPLVMSGYFGNPTATADAVTPDGWLRTGDIAYRADDGYVFVVDRLKDLIISGGYNVYPAEVERVLAGHPGVAQVAVVGTPDPRLGEVAHAFVVRRAGTLASEDELIAHTHGELARYKQPRIVTFVDTLPTTSSGKVMRRLLRATDGPPR